MYCYIWFIVKLVIQPIDVNKTSSVSIVVFHSFLLFQTEDFCNKIEQCPKCSKSFWLTTALVYACCVRDNAVLYANNKSASTNCIVIQPIRKPLCDCDVFCSREINKLAKIIERLPSIQFLTGRLFVQPEFRYKRYLIVSCEHTRTHMWCHVTFK